MVLDFLKYYWRAKTVHQVHSEFVFNIVQDVFDNSSFSQSLKLIEEKRIKLLKSNETIEVVDFGAGSKGSSSSKKSIRNIAKYAVSPPFQCLWLYHLVRSQKINRVLELGTSLGITAAYLAQGNPHVHVTTIEGDPNISKKANDLFDELHVKIDGRCGQFNEVISDLLKSSNTFDLIYIDGHHAKIPTLEYTERLLPILNSDGILIYDDIYWSEGMKEAWVEIKKRFADSLIMDFFFWGIVIPSKTDIEPNEYTLIPQKWKPLQIGIWQ
jgi:predicted O-methyltransferase YrrM